MYLNTRNQPNRFEDLNTNVMLVCDIALGNRPCKSIVYDSFVAYTCIAGRDRTPAHFFDGDFVVWSVNFLTSCKVYICSLLLLETVHTKPCN